MPALEGRGLRPPHDETGLLGGGAVLYTPIQDRPDETINWVVDVEDLVSDIQSNQTVNWHAGPYGVDPSEARAGRDVMADIPAGTQHQKFCLPVYQNYLMFSFTEGNLE